VKSPSSSDTDIIGPGLAQLSDAKQKLRYHTYYFWTPFILLAQLFCFYTPRYIWRTMEGGKMKMLTADLRGLVLDPELIQKKKALLGSYLLAHLGYNNIYAGVFALCELLNFVGVFLQMLFLDGITDHLFFQLGVDSVRYGRTDGVKYSPMARGFPVMGKCTIKVYGDGGNIENHDGICNLPLNMTTQMYFVFMW
jgi:hypothetical protein